MARPTYLLGRELVNVAGESHYQDALRAICGDEHEVRLEREAALVPEPDNPHDPNAVQVLVEGRLVGYLPRAVAPAYLPMVAEIVARGREARCEAMVAGRSGTFGVFLRLPEPGEERARPRARSEPGGSRCEHRSR